jgi:hypothetical protein
MFTSLTFLSSFLVARNNMNKPEAGKQVSPTDIDIDTHIL